MTSGPDWPGVWGVVRERLRRELGDAVFEAWIGPLTLEGCDKNELRIGATKPFVRTWVASHYMTRLDRAFACGGHGASLDHHRASKPQPMIGGGIVRTRVCVTAAFGRDPELHAPRAAETEQTDPAKGLWTRMLHPQQTFDSFVPGMANEFGHTATRAFAEGQNNDFSRICSSMAGSALERRAILP